MLLIQHSYRWTADCFIAASKRLCGKSLFWYRDLTKERGSTMAIATINPATGEVLRVFEPLSDAQADEKIARAAATFSEYRHTSFVDRRRMMTRAAEILEADKEIFGRLMTLEMGKPLRSAVDEAVKCAAGCRYYAENAERFLADEIVETSATQSFIRYQPLGPVLAVMAWT